MRLIDADALREKLIALNYHTRAENMNEACVRAVDYAPTVGGWISVQDRMPEKKGDYIAYTKDGIVWPYWFDDVWFDTLGYATDTVTHWRPLPEPPEEVQE